MQRAGSPTNPSSKHASQTAPFNPQGPLQVNKAWEAPGNKTSLVQPGQPLPSGTVGRKPVATPVSPASSVAGLPKTKLPTARAPTQGWGEQVALAAQRCAPCPHLSGSQASSPRGSLQ